MMNTKKVMAGLFLGAMILGTTSTVFAAEVGDMSEDTEVICEYVEEAEWEDNEKPEPEEEKRIACEQDRKSKDRTCSGVTECGEDEGKYDCEYRPKPEPKGSIWGGK